MTRGGIPISRLWGRLAGAGLLLIGLASGAAAFDYDSYKPENLDAIAARKPPAAKGVDVFPLRKYRFDVTLVSQAAPCKIGILPWAMQAAGISKEVIDSAPITHCIQIKTAKGRVLSLFIQDGLTERLAKEVQPGGKLTLFAVLAYFGQNGPGLVVTGFGAGQDGKTTAAKDCGCGKDFHSGQDVEAAPGTPVPVDINGAVIRSELGGTVIKIELNEHAVVETATAGRCGRYVVIKHTFPNGRAAYLRYAQLGRLIGKPGKPIVVGQQLKEKDIIGEVGSQGRFHFEVRPVDDDKMDRSPEWAQRYGTDASMDWSRYMPVNPAKFDSEAFGGKAATPDKK